MSPILPVRQKAQAIAQPTCDEMQNVCAGVSGMYTLSMRVPSASSNRYLAVPSVETSLRVSLGVPTVQASASRVRRALGRSDIAAKSVTPRRWTQAKIWRAW